MNFFVIWLNEKPTPRAIALALAHLFNTEENLVGDILSEGEFSICFDVQLLEKEQKPGKKCDAIVFSWEMCVFPHSSEAKGRFANNLEFAIAFSQGFSAPVAIGANNPDAYPYLLIDRGNIVDVGGSSDGYAVAFSKK